MTHHRFAELFPLLEGDAFEALKEDIRVNGQHQPCLTCQGQVVDGRNRHRACLELGLDPKTREWDGDEDGLLAYVVSANLHRRDLTSSQRATVAVLLKDEYERQAAERMLAGATADGKAGGRGRKKKLTQNVGEGLPDRHAGEAAEQVARVAGTNREYVAIADRIRREDPGLFEQVRQGRVSIPEARKRLGRPDEPGESVADDGREPATGDEAALAEAGPAGSAAASTRDVQLTPVSRDPATSASGLAGPGPDAMPAGPDVAMPEGGSECRAEQANPRPIKHRTDADAWRDLRKAVKLLRHLAVRDAKRVSRAVHKDANQGRRWAQAVQEAASAVRSLQELTSRGRRGTAEPENNLEAPDGAEAAQVAETTVEGSALANAR
jgi:hypothetical protein